MWKRLQPAGMSGFGPDAADPLDRAERQLLNEDRPSAKTALQDRV
jgi:hypothetical protein